ncbi:hypothetical protein NBRC111894_2754 [Sporolactobacillus inulinus]|uniref:Uncharacterized protein n=1 Tax=Sporolactobacillus inulinus TaxID=2078 RepID=A0A4Y1ZE43_9BACL|nr:hypothetical protein NBRC111894_2754 [Sporolactobacillus inulinus]
MYIEVPQSLFNHYQTMQKSVGLFYRQIRNHRCKMLINNSFIP